MNNFIKFQKTLDKLSEVSPLLNEDARKELENRKEQFMDDIQECQYVKVPLVGVFSAGKSSLLNVFSQKPGMLPIDTTPETAIAYELYYGEKECIEQYRDGKKIDTKPLTDIKQLNTQPGDIAKVYCNSPRIRDLQEKGIILVDMPGIGSGIERHDSAIFNYINERTAFVLVVDAEQGTLRKSTLSFMQELKQYNLGLAVLIAKIDKKTENEVNEIKDYIKYQTDKLGNTTYISTVCAVNDNVTGLINYLDTIDPQKIAEQNLKAKLNIIIQSVIDQLSVRIKLRTSDISDADEKIKLINEEIANTKAEQTINNADSPEKSTQDILDKVKEALEKKSEEIAHMILKKDDEEDIKAVVVSTIRSAIVTSLQDESEQYSAAVCDAAQKSIKDIAKIELDESFLTSFSDIQTIILQYLSKILTVGGVWGKIIKFIIKALPIITKIIQWFTKKSEEEMVEEIRTKFMEQSKQITNGLQPTIYSIVVDNQKRIREKVNEELISKMEKIKDGLREKIADANKSKDSIQNEINTINEAISKLNALCAEI